MSLGEVAFLALALTAFLTFICVIGFVSIWSGRPSKVRAHSTAAPTSASPPTKKNEGTGAAIVSLVGAHPPRAA